MFWIIVSVLCGFGIGGVWFVFSSSADTQAARAARAFRNLVTLAVVAGWILFTGLCSYNQISAGRVGIIYRFSDIVGTTGSGLQWISPWTSVVEANTQIDRHNFDKLSCFSKETQNVWVDATLNIQVSPTNVVYLYKEVGPNFFEVLVAPRVQAAVKDVTVNYLAVDVAPNRENIRKAVRERLERELSPYSIKVDDFLIRNIKFEQRFEASIEDKQIQTQKALQADAKIAEIKAEAQQVRERAAGDADAKLIAAQKEAEANKVLADSLSPNLVNYLMVQKLAPNVNVMMIPPSQQLMMTMPSANSK